MTTTSCTDLFFLIWMSVLFVHIYRDETIYEPRRDFNESVTETNCSIPSDNSSIFKCSDGWYLKYPVSYKVQNETEHSIINDGPFSLEVRAVYVQDRLVVDCNCDFVCVYKKNDIGVVYARGLYAETDDLLLLLVLVVSMITVLLLDFMKSEV